MTTSILGRAMLAVISLSLFGCSDSNIVAVDGKVKLDSKPLKDALVTFTPVEGGRPSYGRTDAEGYYTLVYTNDQDGAEIGRHKIEISTYQEGGGYEDGAKSSKEKVPMKYNSKSELTEEVPAGGTTIDFELESEGQIDSTGGYGGN